MPEKPAPAVLEPTHWLPRGSLWRKNEQASAGEPPLIHSVNEQRQSPSTRTWWRVCALEQWKEAISPIWMPSG